MIYRALVRPLLYLLPAEPAHGLTFALLRLIGALPGARSLLRWLLCPADPALVVDVLGLSVPNPVGLAAGFDKDARGHDVLAALGFGFVEVGTVTATAQSGNPRPRLFRLPADRALVNRMGFNNCGATAAAARLSKPRRAVVGVNIGKTRSAPEQDAIADYVRSTEQLARHADFLVVNVSSPNTPGLRDLQAVDRLRPLLEAVRVEADRVSPGRRVPLLVKIAPDLSDEEVDAVATLALDLRLDGIVATNTTVARQGLRSGAELVRACGAGGLSGPPVAAQSLAVLRRLRARVGSRLVLVSVGGIETAADAWERILAGASLVQIYTSFVYEGPFVAGRIARGLARLVAEAGYARLQDAVGASAD